VGLDLARSGYKTNTKDKSLIILLYSWLHNENQISEYGDFLLFLPLASAELATAKSLLFGEILPTKKKAHMGLKCSPPSSLFFLDKVRNLAK
jgi:hypothetical protein